MIVITLTKDGNQICALMGRDLMAGMAGFGDTPPAALRALADEMEARKGDDWEKYPRNETVFMDCVEKKPTSGIPLHVLIRHPLKLNMMEMLALMEESRAAVGWVPVYNLSDKREGLIICVAGEAEAMQIESVIRPIAEKWANEEPEINSNKDENLA